MSSPPSTSPRLTSLSPGAGCACKLPLAKLEELIAAVGPLPAVTPSAVTPSAVTPSAVTPSAGTVPGAGAATGPTASDLLVGAAEGDDAAVLRLDGGQAVVLTTDFFTPIVDDPGDWGRIAAANALSDVYAMGGRPVIAVNLAAWPGNELDIAILAAVLRGGAEVAASGGCFVVGGHTIDDPVPKYGMAVVGLADPDALLTIDRATPGDQLILTKALGTGVITTALKRDAAPPDALAAAVASMIQLNDVASAAAVRAGLIAATDVTGFGLLGHLHRMLTASNAAARIDAMAVPLLPAAAELAAAGYVSGGTQANTERMRPWVRIDPAVPPETAVLLHDAQTSGGLLLPVPPAAAAGLLNELRDQGLPAALIGQVTDGAAGQVLVESRPL